MDPHQQPSSHLILETAIEKDDDDDETEEEEADLNGIDEN
jgi:hypothetical protein